MRIIKILLLIGTIVYLSSFKNKQESYNFVNDCQKKWDTLYVLVNPDDTLIKIHYDSVNKISGYYSFYYQDLIKKHKKDVQYYDSLERVSEGLIISKKTPLVRSSLDFYFSGKGFYISEQDFKRLKVLDRLSLRKSCYYKPKTVLVFIRKIKKKKKTTYFFREGMFEPLE